MPVYILKKCDKKETVSLYFRKRSAFIPILSLGTSFFSYCLQKHILNLTICLKFAYADSRHRISLHECILYRLFTSTYYRFFRPHKNSRLYHFSKMFYEVEENLNFVKLLG